jgi:hypothetical protein
MELLHVQFFYGLGFHLARLQSVAASDEKLNSLSWSSYVGLAHEWAKSCSELERILPKTKNAAVVLETSIRDFSQLLGQDRRPTVEEEGRLVASIANFYKAFEHEAEDANAFIATSIGINEMVRR